MKNKTLHKADCTRVWKNYDESCARCQELILGAPARKGWGLDKKMLEQQQIQAIRAHSCEKSKCMVVCTFGDW